MPWKSNTVEQVALWCVSPKISGIWKEKMPGRRYGMEQYRTVWAPDSIGIGDETGTS